MLGLAILASRAAAQDMTVYDDALENGWQNYGWATINYANTSPVYSGTASIKVTDPGTSFEAIYLGHGAMNTAPYQSITFYIYPTAKGTDELDVQATIGGASQPAVYLSFTAAQVHHWQQETVTLASLGVANNANFTGFWIQNNTGGPLTFYVDAITLTATPPPDPVPLSVNAKSIVRTIDSRMYGVNLAIWDSLLSGPATGGIVATMQTGMFRFPGGSSSDDYDWQKDESVSKPTFQWPSDAATFAGVTSTQGAQAFVTVNYGSGTPEEAAAWVAYYNGEASGTASLGTDSMGRNWQTVGYWGAIRSGSQLATDDGYNFLRVSHPAPYGIHYWEIGNECYGSWENDLHGASGSTLTGTTHDPYTYAQYFQAFYTKMTAVDPTVRIGAVAVPGEDSYNGGAHSVPNPAEGNSLHSGWTPVMLVTLQSLGVTPGFLIDHNYPQGGGGESDAGLLQDGATLVSNATNLRQIITDYLGATTGGNIELDVTELNSVSDNPGKQSTSLVNGLFMADALGNLANTEFGACTWWDLRNGGSTGGNNSAALYGWREYGDYGVVSSGDISGVPANTPYPTYYAAKLLTHWGRGGDAVVSASSGYVLMSAYASLLQNGDLALLVINKHPTSDLPAQVSLGNFTPGSATAATYSYGKPNDTASGDLTIGTAAVTGSTFNYTFPSYSMTVVQIKSQFEAWREQYFNTAQLAEWSLSGDDGAPAQDGVPNLVKYALGLPPWVPAAAGLPVTGTMSVGGKSYLTLTFTQQSTLTDITYTVQVSSDLVNWESGQAVRADNGTTTTAIYRDLTAIQNAPRHFMRLVITRN